MLCEIRVLRVLIMNQGIEILTKTHSRTLRRKESRKEKREVLSTGFIARRRV